MTCANDDCIGAGFAFHAAIVVAEQMMAAHIAANLHGLHFDQEGSNRIIKTVEQWLTAMIPEPGYDVEVGSITEEDRRQGFSPTVELTIYKHYERNIY